MPATSTATSLQMFTLPSTVSRIASTFTSVRLVLGRCLGTVTVDLLATCVTFYLGAYNFASNLSSASYQNKTFYIFSSVFSVNLSIDCIYIVVLRFLLVCSVVDFIVLILWLHTFCVVWVISFVFSAIEKNKLDLAWLDFTRGPDHTQIYARAIRKIDVDPCFLDNRMT